MTDDFSPQPVTIVPPWRPWAHAGSAYVVSLLLAVLVGFASSPILTAVVVGAGLAGLGWAFSRGAMMSLACGLIGFGFGLVVLFFIEMTASYIGVGPAQFLAPAAATLILYPGVPRRVGIIVLLLLTLVLVAQFSFLVWAFSQMGR